MPPGKSVYPVTLALPALSGIVPSVLLPEALLLDLDVSRPENASPAMPMVTPCSPGSRNVTCQTTGSAAGFVPSH